MGHSEGNPREKFIATQAYLKKIEISQINNLTIHLKGLEEQQQRNPRVSRRKEIIIIKAKIIGIETKKKTKTKNQ